MLFAKICPSVSIIYSFLIFIILSLNCQNTAAGRDRGARCEKPDYIQNGNYRLRRERVMRITCDAGYQLQGSKTIDCVRGKWEGEKPVCAKKGCSKDLEQPENGRIQIENDVKAIIYCSDNYNLAGNRHSYCNGTHWDRPIGNCREHKNVIQHECDFETDDICGWTYEPREGLEWKRVMAANVFTSFKTGPRHDHTTLKANGGHYMLMESLTKNDDDVILTSPIYDRGLSLKTACCFQFFYFMYGAGVGDLFVIVKPVSLSLKELQRDRKELIKFKKYGNQNNIWNEAHFNIEELDEDFQILFLAKSGSGQLSDIAIDDVRLLTGNDCKILDKDNENTSDEENDSTTYESIYEMESCIGRCFESHGNGVQRKFGHLKGLCNCDTDCEDNDTCCPDFRSVCLNKLFEQSSDSSLVDETTQLTEEIIKSTTTPGTTSTRTTTTRKITSTTTPKTTTTIRTTIRTTPTTTPKTTPTTTLKTTPTTTSKTTPTTKTTIFSTTPTTPKPIIITSTKTTPKTTTTTTRKTTPTTTIATRKTTPKPTTTRRTTPKTTLRTTQKTTARTTTTTTQKTTTTSTTTVPKTTKTTTTVTPKIPKATTSTQIPLPIEYIINDKSKTDTSHNGTNILLYIFIVIVAIILLAAVYRRFGDKAVTWYMIGYKQNSSGVEDSTSITTSFKRPQAYGTTMKSKPRTNRCTKSKKSTSTNDFMNTPLVNEDDDDDDIDINCANGTIVLNNNIFTDL